MNWSHVAPLAALGYIGFLLLVGSIRKAVKVNRKRRARALLARLNSPFFRNVYDSYYRVGNISGVGK